MDPSQETQPRELLRKLELTEQLARGSKLKRFLEHPWRYASSILHRNLVYPRRGSVRSVATSTWFGASMYLPLPAGTDIYLTGGKSHDSELRLARWLIEQLKPGDHFLDVGAHFGYFSLLAAQCVGPNGRVLAVEAASAAYEVLSRNAMAYPQIKALHRAATAKAEELTFYEFPNLYSEYNSIDVEQYRDQAWFQRNPPRSVVVQGLALTELLESDGLQPCVVKIDVEGAEWQVIQGATDHLRKHTPVLVLEYVSAARGDEQHAKAHTALLELGYAVHRIKDDGGLEALRGSASDYLLRTGEESDNLVYAHQQTARPS